MWKTDIELQMRLNRFLSGKEPFVYIDSEMGLNNEFIKEFVMQKCPQCQGSLRKVRNDSMYMNSEQFDSVKAGDWYCEACPGNGRGESGLCYWWDSDLEKANERILKGCPECCWVGRIFDGDACPKCGCDDLTAEE